MSWKKEIILDKSGNEYLIGKSMYKGEVLTHIPISDGAILLSSIQDFSLREDDIWIQSYPSTGCHWLYEIVGILLNNKLEPLSEFKETRFLEFHGNAHELDDLPSPRILNTHIRLKYLPKTLFDKTKTICIIRNPKSVAVSEYFHNKNGPDKYQGTLDDHLPIFYQGKYTIHGNWYENVLQAWNELHSKPNVLFVFYEELKQDTVNYIEKIARFLELDRSRSFCEGVAELTTIESLKTFKGKEEHKHSHIIKQLYRKGTISDWKNHFTVAQNDEFDKIYAEKMKNHPELMKKITFE